MSGYALYKGASFLGGQLGKRLAPELVQRCMTMAEWSGDWARDRSMGKDCRRERTTVVDKGCSRAICLIPIPGKSWDCHRAAMPREAWEKIPRSVRRISISRRGPARRKTLSDGDKQGLYVTELIGFGINMVTGDYSRGAGGFWIEKGELAYPVEEITIAGNLKQMFPGHRNCRQRPRVPRAHCQSDLEDHGNDVAGN